MKATVSRDKLMRFTFTVKTRVCFDTLFTFFLNYHLEDIACGEDIEKLIKSRTKKQILAEVRETILNDGVNMPAYRVSDSDIDKDVYDKARTLMWTRFPELLEKQGENHDKEKRVTRPIRPG